MDQNRWLTETLCETFDSELACRVCREKSGTCEFRIEIGWLSREYVQVLVLLTSVACDG